MISNAKSLYKFVIPRTGTRHAMKCELRNLYQMKMTSVNFFWTNYVLNMKNIQLKVVTVSIGTKKNGGAEKICSFCKLFMYCAYSGRCAYQRGNIWITLGGQGYYTSQEASSLGQGWDVPTRGRGSGTGSLSAAASLLPGVTLAFHIEKRERLFKYYNWFPLLEIRSSMWQK